MNLLSFLSVWQSVWPYLVAVLVFLVMIVIHEFGHFIAAKLFGVKVNEFSVGFGPTLLRKKGKETEYMLKAVPFGGYCAMEGENEESLDNRAFCNQKPIKRFIIIIMGAIFNIVFGFILVMFLLAPEEKYASTTISQFKENAVSVNYGLNVGDEIINVNGRKIVTTMDLSYAFTNVQGNSLDVTVKRDGKKVLLNDVQFATEFDSKVNMNYVAVDFYVEPIEKNFGTFLAQSAKTTVSYIQVVWRSLVDLITGKYGISAVSGPVGITVALGSAARQSMESLMYIIALMTINLGVFNLLPVPALDGSHALFILAEMILRKPVPKKVEAAIHAVGFILLIGIILVVTVKDVIGLF